MKTLHATHETWSDSRITVYRSDDEKLYIELAFKNTGGLTYGCFIELSQHNYIPGIIEEDYVVAYAAKCCLRHKNVKLEMYSRPRVACTDTIKLHVIDSLHKRTRCKRVESKGLIPQGESM